MAPLFEIGRADINAAATREYNDGIHQNRLLV
jgi:hypothetical protein